MFLYKSSHDIKNQTTTFIYNPEAIILEFEGYYQIKLSAKQKEQIKKQLEDSPLCFIRDGIFKYFQDTQGGMSKCAQNKKLENK